MFKCHETGILPKLKLLYTPRNGRTTQPAGTEGSVMPELGDGVGLGRLWDGWETFPMELWEMMLTIELSPAFTSNETQTILWTDNQPFFIVESRRNLKSALAIQDPVELFGLIGTGLGPNQILILDIIIFLPEILSPIATGHNSLYLLAKNMSAIAF